MEQLNSLCLAVFLFCSGSFMNSRTLDLTIICLLQKQSGTSLFQFLLLNNHLVNALSLFFSIVLFFSHL